MSRISGSSSTTRIARRDAPGELGGVFMDRGISASPTGNVNVKAAPPSGGQSTLIAPPCASTMPRLTASPTPVAGRLGREVRLEHPCPDLGRNAGSIVRDRYADGLRKASNVVAMRMRRSPVLSCSDCCALMTRFSRT